MNNFVCSFFGHRDVEITDELTEKTTKEIEQVLKQQKISSQQQVLTPT